MFSIVKLCLVFFTSSLCFFFWNPLPEIMSPSLWQGFMVKNGRFGSVMDKELLTLVFLCAMLWTWLQFAKLFTENVKLGWTMLISNLDYSLPVNDASIPIKEKLKWPVDALLYFVGVSMTAWALLVISPFKINPKRQILIHWTCL